MKSILLRIGVAVMLMLMLVGCQAPAPDGLDVPATTQAADETDAPRAAGGPVIHAGNVEQVRLIRSDALESDALAVKLTVAFRNQLGERLGAKPEIGTDFVFPNRPVLPEDIEIIIGETTRPTSLDFHTRLMALGTPAYGISVSENKISVSGSSAYLVYLGLDYLLENFITTAEDGKPQLALENGFEWIMQAESDYPAPREVIDSGRDIAFYTLEQIVKTPTQGNYRGMQGGGTDGKYAYYASIDGSTTPETAIIHKYDLATWTLVATSEPMPSAHTNDITYDAKNHRLVISYCSATDGYLGLVFVNPDTLAYIDYLKAPTASRGVAYLPETNQYVLAVNYTYYITDDQFRTVRSIPDGFPQLTSQGCDCDGDLIYDPRWEPGAAHQTISINSLNGEFIGAIPLYGISGEPENIFCDGNTFVMGCTGPGAVYRIVLLYENWWEA